ncbi:hypothetical protein M2322_004169 [Rhodoblastus acidophilus]|uniref:hypothetical protein n=1 Tax=Rhodoblastus acidophilus TaxID=1074 RepID=UPI002224B6A1|nr:hypothetical protein [Rhodoblastus acidophilus]MCW2318600.1 hypothetical protein [Rhodoblastus acidophilus]
MERKKSELAEIAAAKLQRAIDAAIATKDPKHIAWAQDQFRHAEALLRRVVEHGHGGVRDAPEMARCAETVSIH